MAKVDLRVVAINETRYWADEITSQVDNIWGLYLYDANRQVHCCEVTPSYELFFIRSEATGLISDELDEAIMEGDRSSEEVRYFHCPLIDALPADRFITDVWTAEPYDTDDEYRELIDDVLEHLRCNYNSPRCVA